MQIELLSTKNIKPLILFFCIVCIYPAVMAQNDRHYNSIQYGLRGIIMNGAMVAGVNDNSAIYYNPAALSISSTEGLDVSLFAITLDIYKKKHAFGQNNNAKRTGIKVVPGLVTFIKSPFKNKNIKVGAALLTRHSFDNKMYGQVTQDLGNQLRINEINYEYRVKEFWASLAVSYKFKKNVSLGISQYFSLSTQHYEHAVAYNLFDKTSPGKLDFQEKESLVLDQKQFLGMISKVGMTWYSKHIKFGMTLTTPSYLKIIRSATVKYNKSLFQGDSLVAEIASFKNKGKQKDPFSATAGIEWNHKGFLIAAAVEYYHFIKEYDRVNSKDEEVVYPQNVAIALKDSRKRVFNINLGWEIPLVKKLYYLGGFRTNFNFNNQSSDFSVPRLHMSYFDIYHLTTGLKVEKGKNRFTVGIDYAFSFDHKLPVVIDLNAAGIPKSNAMNSSILYNNLTFMITYNFLLEKIKKVE